MKKRVRNAARRALCAAACLLLVLALCHAAFATGTDGDYDDINLSALAEMPDGAESPDGLSEGDREWLDMTLVERLESDPAATLFGGISGDGIPEGVSGFLGSYQPVAEDVYYDDFYIQAFDVDMTINENRSIAVKETIDVNFRKEMHGITRTLPGYTSDELLQIRDVNVTGAPFTTVGDDTLRIGDPNVTVEGQREYVITYTVAYLDDIIPDYDRIYRDILGPDTSVPIVNLTARVRFPAELSDGDLLVYSGASGRKDNEYVNWYYFDGVMYVYNTKELSPYAAVTFEAKMPEGTFSEPSLLQPDYYVEKLDIDIKLDKNGFGEVTENYRIRQGGGDTFTVCGGGMYAYTGSGRTIDLVRDDEVTSINGNEYKNGNYNSARNGYPFEKEIQEFTHTYKFRLEVTEKTKPGALKLELVEYFGGELVSVENVSLKVNSEVPLTSGDAWCGEMVVAPDTAVYGFSENTDGGVFTAKSFGTFPVGETATLKLNFDDGFVRRKTAADFALPGAGIAGIVLSLLGVFSRKNKEKQLVPAPEYYAPGGLNPAEVGYIMGREADPKDVTTLIYYWASHGHLAIEMEQGGHYTLHWLSELDSAHRDYERTLFDAIWRRGNAEKGVVRDIQLNEKIYKKIDETAASVKYIYSRSQSLEDETAKKRSGRVITAAIALFAVLAGVSTFVDPFAGGAFAAFAGAVALIWVLSRKANEIITKQNSKHKGIVWNVVVIAVVAVLIAVLACAMGGAVLSRVAALAGAAGLALTAVNGARMRQRSDFGTEVIGRCMGFKEFLKTAEKDRLEMLLEENPDYYYDILPYAQVLGVSDIWTKKFEGLLTRTPDWFYGPNVTYMTANRMMRSNMNRMNRVMTSRPIETSSGGGFSVGGGGFSGGFGGGGGGFGGGSSGGGGGGGVGGW